MRCFRIHCEERKRVEEGATIHFSLIKDGFTISHHVVASDSWHTERILKEISDRYFVAYKPIILPCISFMFIEMKFIHNHSCLMFAMKSMSICMTK